jgi:MerR family transcriptional regulator, redox-sensitive transcriptional activator SoxR
MTIGELAKAFAVRPSTLRFYERIGILAPAGRISGKRQYDRAAEDRLAFILSARASGFTLTEIKGLISAAAQGNSPRRLWRGAAATKRVRVEKEIRRLRAVQKSLERKAACRCKTLRDCERLLARERYSEIAR